jgi:hypothetical protein
MRKRITRIAPVQLGKVSAVLSATFSIPVALFLAVVTAFAPAGQGKPLALILAVPVFYVVFGFVFMAFSAWIYNLVAKWTGGVEFVTVEMPDT